MDSSIDLVLNKIIECLKKYENFCLDAGAGSGKTYTLVQTIKYINEELPNKKIVCITFTNNAKDEIISRLPIMDNIFVSTIHDFIWKNICRFQSVLRNKVNELIEEKIIKYKIDGDIERLEKYEHADLNLPILYRDYQSLSKGIISHDTLLDFFLYFLGEEDFCNILFSSFDYIFIDEYQDTNKKIFPVFCNSMIEFQKKEKSVVMGLFGDYMQNIYNEGIGELDSNLIDKFTYIQKQENFRSCQEIIDVNNCLRDDLKQICMSPNKVKGSIKFIYNYSKDFYLNDFLEYKEYKRLHLTHRIISMEIGFENIYSIYYNKYFQNTSNILKNADERFLRYICKEIMPSIYEYKNGVSNKMIKNINIEYFNFDFLNTMENKIQNTIDNMECLKINDFLNNLFEINIFSRTMFYELIQSYMDSDDEEFLQKIFEISAIEFYNYYLQFSDRTLLETMHGTKGNEFDNVLININENTTWNWYDFSKLITQQKLKDSVKLRTSKLLYVICTRAKQSLIINYIVDKSESKNDECGEILKNNVRRIWGDKIEFEIIK